MEVSMILPTRLPKAKKDVKIADGYHIVKCSSRMACEWMDYERLCRTSSLAEAIHLLQFIKRKLYLVYKERNDNFTIIKVSGSSFKDQQENSNE